MKRPQFEKAELQNIWRAKIANIQMAWREFESKSIELESMPFRAIVELTQNCNFKCVMCPQSWEPQYQKFSPDLNMPMDAFVRIAEELFPKATFIDLRGFGETTILPYWNEVLDILEYFPLVDWHLVTNLGLARDQMWDHMIKLGFLLGFSCDGATKETFESIRINGKFNQILNNLEIIKNARKKYQKGFLYFLSTIQKKNIHEMKALVEMAAKYEVQEVQFKSVRGSTDEISLYAMDEGKVKEYVDGAISAAIDLGVRITFNDWFFTKGISPERVQRAAQENYHQIKNFNYHTDPDFWQKEQVHVQLEKFEDAKKVSFHQRCFKPFSFTYINYKAQMGTCNHMMFPDMLVMGDLRLQSIRDIWNSPKYQNFRHQLISAKPLDDRCKWCFKHRMDD